MKLKSVRVKHHPNGAITVTPVVHSKNSGGVKLTRYAVTGGDPGLIVAEVLARVYTQPRLSGLGGDHDD